MIDQEKILGHREPYNGMGEVMGLLRLMSNQQRKEEKVRGESKRKKNQPRDQRTKIKDQGQEPKDKKQKHTKERTSQKDNSRYDKIIHPRHQTPHPVKYAPKPGNTKTKRVPIHRALKSPNSDCPA